MARNAADILKRVRLISVYLSNGLVNEDKIKQMLSHEGVDISIETIQQDIRDIYAGKYPDPWLDNFLSIEYPLIFKQTLEEIKEACIRLKTLAGPANNKQIQIMANNGIVKGQTELIKVLERGPNIRMMKKLKVKTERLAKEIQEERTITKKNEDLSNIF